ncbi:DNA helicase PcrA [Selenomonas sp.]|uniref:DNA helicase PcrA n=1 Tax=Selenomonas sp. TaxID=2053611 RepID=UPI001CB43A29|nr:DNA helicase PcrA [Selenomonas sp.]MBF1693043.1 DNA helicase PcrA [Selenomonas sp.]
MDLMQGLNEPQQRAVACLQGPLLIVAGAGSGKTRVLTFRIANLLEHGVPPYRILAITFTNKAAREMRERVDALIGDAAQDVWLSTFHSFCARFLRMELEHYGRYAKNFVIYDAADSKGLIRECLKELNIDEKHTAPGAVQAHISDAKNRLLDVAAFTAQATDFFAEQVAKIYALYQSKLQENNALDFDDLLMLTVELLTKNEELRTKYQKKFQYILVDEYQDTNGAQYAITKLLAAEHRNICVVGDADQSIYGWRGADMRNIMNFEKDYPEATVILLEQNYRSTKNILAAANAVIENNLTRKKKELWTDNPTGDRITIYEGATEKNEASYIVREVERLHTMFHVKYGDIAVLYRTNAQSRNIEEAFYATGVPYAMVGSVRFYDRREIKDIIAYLRVIYNPRDTLSLLRIINVPRRGLGPTSIARMMETAEEYRISLFEVITDAQLLSMIPKLSAKVKLALEEFAAMVFTFMGQLGTRPIHEIVEDVIETSGYAAALEEEKKEDNRDRLENLREFISVAKNFDDGAAEGENGLADFLAQIALISDVDQTEQSDGTVTLMTFHAAKGLEFPAVFMAGMEEGLFPHSRTLLDDTEIEEERRTCYVGITRAERRLYLTYARQRTIYGRTEMSRPSRFLAEIPEELVEHKEADFFSGTDLRAPSNIWSERSTRTERKRYMPPQQHTAADGSVIRPDASAAFQAGDAVRHSKWGDGRIVAISGSGEDAELSIAFPGEGIKKFVQKYAPILKL